MVHRSNRIARRHAGPRPTLPPGGRIWDTLAPNRRHARDAASQRSNDICAHPGSGAALCSAGQTP